MCGNKTCKVKHLQELNMCMLQSLSKQLNIFWKYTNLLSGTELDEKSDTNFTFVSLCTVRLQPTAN